MILSIILILVVGLVAYLHYIQGLLSGLISVVLALVATAIAIANYEPMATSISGGKYNDQAQGICLIGLFAVVYIVGRVIFDKLVPGNVRLPHLVDAIGGAVCGVIAGIMLAGLIAIAMQSMPFGISVAGYARYPLAGDRERSVSVPQAEGGRNVDRLVIDELKNGNIDKDSQGLILPVDDMVVGFAKHLSDGGTLANDKPFEHVHPDLMQELFGQRLGIEAGAKHTASNEKGQQVEVVQANVLTAPITQTVGEYNTIWLDPPKGKLTAEPGKRLVTVTVVFKAEAGDEDHLVRLSPGSVRLVTHGTESSDWKNNYPIGTVQAGLAWMDRIDDFLFIKEDKGAHFLFSVPDDALVDAGGGGAAPATPAAKGGKGSAAAAAVTAKFAPDCFIEVKRMAKISLDDVKVEIGLPPASSKYYPLRKAQFYKEKEDGSADQASTPAETPSTPTASATSGQQQPNVMDRIRGARSRGDGPAATATPATPTPPAGGDNGWADAPLESPSVVSGSPLPVGINVGTADADAEVVTTAASGHITGKKFDVLDVDTSSDGAALTELPKGGNPVAELAVPAGKRLVAVKLNIKAGGDPWAWAAALADYTVVDGAGASVKPSGVIGTVTKGRGAPPRLLANYKANGEVASVGKVEGTTPTGVTLLYVLPADQKAKEIQYKGKAGGLPLEN